MLSQRQFVAEEKCRVIASVVLGAVWGIDIGMRVTHCVNWYTPHIIFHSVMPRRQGAACDQRNNARFARLGFDYANCGANYFNHA